MSTCIHPSATIHPNAILDENVVIGPYCVVGEHVHLKPGVHLRSHVSVDGHTTLGAGCVVWPFASVGGQTQDLKFKGGAPRLTVGDHTMIRECATLSCATLDGDETKVGSHCLIMAYAHVAHDCIIGDHVIMANAATLAGHVVVEDHVILGGMAGVHQFVRVGRMSILGGCTKAVKDVPPFMMADGTPLKIFGPNKIGLDRHQVSVDSQKALKDAYKLIYRTPLTVAKALEQIEAELPQTPEIQHFVQFIRNSQRGISK